VPANTKAPPQRGPLLLGPEVSRLSKNGLFLSKPEEPPPEDL
jgi:hypothetical protein